MLRKDADSSVLDRPQEELIEIPSKVDEPPQPLQGPPFRMQPRSSSNGSKPEPPVSNARLAMLVFLGCEAMLFAGLIGAFLVYRLGSEVWPPSGQPHLPLLITWVNTVVLLLSGYTMRSALRALRVGDHEWVRTGLSATALLGVMFLVVQGSVGSADPIRSYPVGRDLRRHLLYRHRLSRYPCPRRGYLAVDRPPLGERGAVDSAPPRCR